MIKLFKGPHFSGSWKLSTTAAAALVLAGFVVFGNAEGLPVFRWEPLGLGGGGAMYTPAIGAADPDRVLLNCDMGGVYRSEDGGP